MRFLSIRASAALLMGLVVFCSVPPRAFAAHQSSVDQLTFVNPEEAVVALLEAVKQDDLNRIYAILGPGSEALIRSGDTHADAAVRQKFSADYDARHKLTEVSPGREVLIVGANDWPLPVPVVLVKGRWKFDSRAGAQQIIDRRIGRNEISAIRVALTFVDAQRDYFERSKQHGGAGQYAQLLASTSGQRDGLYWVGAPGEPESPFGPLVAQAVEEGYPGDIEAGRQIPYQGYFFRILKAQSENAPGGTKNYMENGRMTGGFALIAWPARYGSSGVMTFQVNQDGVVYQRNLGVGTTTLVAAMNAFDVDVAWTRVDLTSD
jgi:Protein of unknown function (DUF2950)